MQTIGIGLAGFGTVGAGVFEDLHHQRDLLAERTRFTFDVRRIAVGNLKKERDVAAPPELFTASWRDLLSDPEIQIIVELIGGTTEAFELIKAAIESGRSVVTGNKALLAEHGQEIFAMASKHQVAVFYEAAVAGAIPIIQSLRDGYVGNRIESIHGILNGTSNYILSRMQEAGLDYEAALEEATQFGYAETDPTLDVNGWDTAHKTIVLAALAYGLWVAPEAIRVEGIQSVTAADIQFAQNMGYMIKLLATIHADSEGNIKVGVAPTLIPKKSVLASISGVFNAVAVKGDLVGDALFYGRGAGRHPTASSVIADLIEAAIALESPRCSVGLASHHLYKGYCAADEIVSSYYLRLSVVDQPGVLAAIAGILGEAGVGIASVVQPQSQDGTETALVFMTHAAPYGVMHTALKKIGALSCVKKEPVLFNVESLG